MSAAAELNREQDYLTQARAALARMREQTLSLKVQAHDPISAEHLARTLHLRAASLQDDPSSTLFFGRIDTESAERWYIGRRHVTDDHGDPLVIDWRAGMSTAFYRASRAEPMDVVLRRRFGLDHGRITAYEDEHLQNRSEHEARSQILAEEIERPRVGPMRDIVATIQPEQDEIVRAGADQTICVQGAPGTGKTAVGLHRAAWLLYAFRDRLARSGVLVIGPNRAFLEHIGAVLPALGEVAVGHTTIEELTASVRCVVPTAPKPLCSKAMPVWRRCCDVPCGHICAAPTRPSWCRADHGSGACRRTRSTSFSTSCVTGACATTRPGRCCRSGSPTPCSCRWRAPATPQTTGSRTLWRAAPR